MYDQPDEDCGTAMIASDYICLLVHICTDYEMFGKFRTVKKS